MDDLRANIRRSETSKAKYESRLECLRTSGAPVEEWLKEVDLLAVTDTLPRSSSLLSVRTDASGAAVSAHMILPSFITSKQLIGGLFQKLSKLSLRPAGTLQSHTHR